MPLHLGDHVRFRSCQTLEALRGQKRHVGVVVALVAEADLEPWPVVQLEGYRAALQQGLIEVVGEPGVDA